MVVTNLQLFSTSKSHPCCTSEDSSGWSLQPQTLKHEKSQCTEVYPSTQVSAHTPTHTPLILWAHRSCKLQEAPRISSQADFLEKKQSLVTRQVQACVPSPPSLLPSSQQAQCPLAFFSELPIEFTYCSTVFVQKNTNYPKNGQCRNPGC